jgi:DNA-binding MarR family transcriptional regulator
MSESTMPDDTGQQTGIDEAVQLASDFLFQTWLIIDRILPGELRTITNGLKRRRIRQGTGLTTNFMIFLCTAGVLHRYGSMTMGELSRVTSIPRSSATRIIEWMVDNEYVDRFRDGEDARVVRIRLTDSGLELLLAAKAQLREVAAKLAQRLPAIQRAAVVLTLTDPAITGGLQSVQLDKSPRPTLENKA